MNNSTKVKDVDSDELVNLLQQYSERFWGYKIDERLIINFLKDMEAENE